MAANKKADSKFKFPFGAKKKAVPISDPRNFRQLTHIGYNKETGEFEVRENGGLFLCLLSVVDV
jgi:hypothetical protein